MLDTRPYESQACWLATAKGLGCEEWEGHSHSSIQTRDRRYIWCICRVFYFEALRILQNFQCVRCGIRVSKAAAVWAGGFRGGHGHRHGHGHGHGHGMTASTPQGLDERERREERRGEERTRWRTGLLGPLTPFSNFNRGLALFCSSAAELGELGGAAPRSQSRHISKSVRCPSYHILSYVNFNVL